MKKILQVFYRSLNRNRNFLLINITGLAIGLGVSLMLLLFVATELSYDRHFANKERIVQLNTVWIEDGEQSIEPISLRGAYSDLPSVIPGIESAVQIYRGWTVELKQEKNRFQDIRLLYADPSFFEVFQMEAVNGNLASALNAPNAVVITDKLAEKVFGHTEVIGKSFYIREQLFNITAIVHELPANTHFSFDMLASMESLPYLQQLGGLEFFTYYLLKPNVKLSEVCNTINETYISRLNERFGSFNVQFQSLTIPLVKIYLHSKASYGLGNLGSVESVVILAGLAFMILLLAVANFINLFIVQGNKRAFEVGIRKTIGGSMKDIAVQYFTEATVIVIVAFVLGALLSAACLKPFAAMINKTVAPELIYSPFFIAGIIVLTLVTIVLSASYPAFYLSGFRPAETLKKAHRPDKHRLTASIAIFQSVITIVLITVILVVSKQLKHLQNIPKGYQPEQVMVFSGLNNQLVSHYEALRNSLEKLPQVIKVSGAQHIVGGGTSGQGIHLLGNSGEETKSINEYRVMPGLCELMGFEPVEGKFFGMGDSLNKSHIVINEAAAKMLGIYGSAIGRKVVMFENPMDVIGVVRDFYYNSPAEVIHPIALTSYKNQPNIIYIRFDQNIPKDEAFQAILPVIRQYDPDFIINPRWCEDIYANKFEKEKSLSEIITAGTALSLIIALLGLLAIHAYSTTERTKEIGIRKVMGSTVWAITQLLSSYVVKLMLIAGLVAIPTAYLIEKSWLENYANRITIGWTILLLPVVIQTAIAALITIAVSWRICAGNPVEALRYE